MTNPVATVFGGTGFIGRPVVARLLERGYEVRTVSRRRAGQTWHPRWQHVSANLADTAAVRDAVSGSSVVCHVATGGGDTWADYQRDFIDATRSIAEAALACGVGRFVYTSSVAALYLGRRGSLDEREGADPRPLARGPYSRAKIEAERLLMDLHRERGLPVVIVRPAIVVGRGGMITHSGLGLWQSPLDCIGLGSGRHPLPFVLVDDVADAMDAACTVPGIEGQSFNLAGDVRPSAREYLALVRDASRRRYAYHARSLAYLQAIEIGKWMLKIVARKADNPFPSFRHLKSASMRTSIDSSAAKRTLGWKPNADRQRLIDEAIVSNIEPVPDGDLRLAALDAAGS